MTPSEVTALFFFSEQAAEDAADPLPRSSNGLTHRIGHIRHEDGICGRALNQKGKLPFRLTEGCELRESAHHSAAVVQLGKHLKIQSVVRADGAIAGDGADLRKDEIKIAGLN